MFQIVADDIERHTYNVRVRVDQVYGNVDNAEILMIDETANRHILNVSRFWAEGEVHVYTLFIYQNLVCISLCIKRHMFDRIYGPIPLYTLQIYYIGKLYISNNQFLL